MSSKKSTTRSSQRPVNAGRIEKLARKAGYSVEKLHALWLAGKAGDAISDKRIQNLLARFPAIMEAFNLFARGDDPRERCWLRRELSSNKQKKKRETLWSAAKLKWVSVVSGGLPTFGKRR
jgi:hypothetical protein